jgi:hypothetical protein
MNPMPAMPLILVLSALALTAPAVATEAGSQWRAYVCRVTDWPDCEQNRNDRRIYPDPARYPDRSGCLEVFGQRFVHDPLISDKYPQTSDAGNSYVYDCEPAP